MDNPNFQKDLVHIDIEPGSDTLIVAFTGKAAKFNMIRPFDFFQLTGLLHYNRILLREPWHYAYLKGIDKSGLPGLVKWLEQKIELIAPKRVIFIGVSSGGFAALLLGHLLKPDYVHAFSPFTYFNVKNVLRNGDYKNAVLQWPMAMLRLNLLLPFQSRQYLDLKPSLMRKPGKTRYYIHACAHSSDRTRAEHLKDCPNTRVFLYPCATHNVTWTIIKSRCIKDLLKEDNLDRAEDVYLSYYSDFNPDNCCGSKTVHPIESIPAMAKGKNDPS
jgi:hypothetical protein